MTLVSVALSRVFPLLRHFYTALRLSRPRWSGSCVDPRFDGIRREVCIFFLLLAIRLYGTWGYRGFALQECVRKTAFVVFEDYDLDQRGSALMTVLLLLPLMMMDGTR